MKPKPTIYAAVERDGCIAEVALIGALPAIVAGEGQGHAALEAGMAGLPPGKGRQILGLTRADMDLLPRGIEGIDHEKHSHPEWPL